MLLDIPAGCTKDDDCPQSESCINRQCRDPCNCGINAACYVKDHKPVCSCREGYQGNPNLACHSVECRSDSDCTDDKSCVNTNCVNPCLLSDPCASNAECYATNHVTNCRCRSGYYGNPSERCLVIGCYSNSDCPDDHACINMQCVDPCLRDRPCSSRAECRAQNHISVCRCPPQYSGNPYVNCQPIEEPECRQDGDCPTQLACLNQKCQDPCPVIYPCQDPAECTVLPTFPVRTMACVCPSGYVSSGSSTCEPTVPIVTFGQCTRDTDCPTDKACINAVCKDPCDCGAFATCHVNNHKPICSCDDGYVGDPNVQCARGRL